jgi:hypothetical protein
VGRSDKRVLASITKSLDDPAASSWECDYRYVRASGEVAHVHDRGYVVYDAQRKPLRMVGVMQDITEQKTAEEEREKMKKYNTTESFLDPNINGYTESLQAIIQKTKENMNTKTLTIFRRQNY